MPKLGPNTMLPVFLVVAGIIIWWFIISYKITIEEKPLKKNFSGTQIDVPIMVSIPGSYGPTKISENLFSFRINFDKVDFPHKKVSPNQRNSLRILISVKNDKNKLRSFYRTSEAKSRLAFLGEENGFELYEKHIGKDKNTVKTYYLKKSVGGNPIVISTLGHTNFRVYRAISQYVELDYVFSKELGIQNWDELDQFILNIVDTFIEPPNKAFHADSLETRALR